jgi:hypothetical protein
MTAGRKDGFLQVVVSTYTTLSEAVRSCVLFALTGTSVAGGAFKKATA